MNEREHEDAAQTGDAAQPGDSEQTGDSEQDEQIDIVLVEDSEADHVSAVRMLRKFESRVSVEHHPSGESMIDAMLDRSPETFWPRLFILDVNLPGRSGIEVLRWLKTESAWTRVPAMVLSGSADEREVQRCYDFGAAGYLTKPTGADDLASTWHAIIEYWVVHAVAAAGPMQDGERRSGSTLT